MICALTADMSCLQAELADLMTEIESGPPECLGELRELLFGEDEHLLPGFIEFRAVPASGATRMTITANVTDRLRELVAAFAAGEIDRHRVEKRHGASSVDD